MTEQADPGTPLRLREPANLVSPKARLMWLVEGAIFMLVLLGGQVAWWVIDGRGSRTPHRVVGAVGLVVSVLYLSIMPVWRYRMPSNLPTVRLTFSWSLTNCAISGMLPKIILS